MKIIVAIFDRATQSFSDPFAQVTKGAAQRLFQDAINQNDPKNQFKNHPEDYEMYTLGEFDEQNGKIQSITPELLARAKDLIIREN